ncbi:Bardet-Biedl syndrome 12 protein homolog [Saccostrea echinata]|uniref:Bardet-Biedl syndrome 12 protein homolog n=1 Tax=Saccostrea echinata TaxID=191078 RepID=UPI002A7F3EA5|nr:Bardet-Biedl syndrome 12 protein homolog [Saccostrea echinata]
MLNIQAEDEEDVEDVTWFFTEDTPLDTSQINGPEATFSTGCGVVGHFDVDVDEVVKEGVQFMSLKNEEGRESNDDEFKDCFDDIPKVVKSQTFQSTTCRVDSQTSQKTQPSITMGCLSHNTKVSCYKSWESRLQQKVSQLKCQDENEFDQSFEKSPRKPGDICEQDLENMSIKQQQLIEKLQKTSKVKSSHNQVWNCSRHFKTMESTVKELRGENDPNHSREMSTTQEEMSVDSFPATVHEKLETKDTESVKNLNDLISKLRIQTSSYKIFNRSRHYKTVKSTLDEQHGVKDDDLLTVKEKYLKIQLLEKTKNISLNEGDEEFSFANPGNQSIGDVAYQTIAKGVRQDCKDVLGGDYLDIDVGYQSIARGLSHGCEDVMDIVLKVVFMQTPNQDALKLNVSGVSVVTSTVGFLSDNPVIVDGTVIEVSSDVITGLVNKGRQILRTVVINGDITTAFRHKGYKSTLDTVNTSISSQQYITQREDAWIEQVIQTLEMEQIDAVLASGKICPDLQGHLPNVVMVQNVPFPALQCICVSSDITMATYVSDIGQFHICPCLAFEPLHDDWVYCHTDKQYVTVKLPKKLTQSVVYSHPAQIGRDCFEQEFWRCCKSLSKALGMGSVLPGKGKTEELCALALLDKADMSKNGTKSLVMRELAQVLLSYYHYVCNYTSITQLVNSLILSLGERESSLQSPSCRINSMQDDLKEHIECYDEGTTKMASWDIAINTALTLLQIDSYILTGSNSSNQIL